MKAMAITQIKDKYIGVILHSNIFFLPEENCGIEKKTFRFFLLYVIFLCLLSIHMRFITVYLLSIDSRIDSNGLRFGYLILYFAPACWKHMDGCVCVCFMFHPYICLLFIFCLWNLDALQFIWNICITWSGIRQALYH